MPNDTKPRRSPRNCQKSYDPEAEEASSKLDTILEKDSSTEDIESETEMDETIVDVTRQIQELRDQLQTAEANAASEKQHRIRLQEQLIKQAMPITISTAASMPVSTVSSTNQRLPVYSSAGLCQSANILTASTVPEMSTSVIETQCTPYQWLPPMSIAPQLSVPATVNVSAAPTYSSFTLPQATQTIVMTTAETNPNSSHTQRVSTFLPSLNTIPHYSQSTNFAPPPFYASPSYAISQSTSHGGRKLHDLPEFTGRPEEWPMFCTAFTESTSMFNYSKVENIFRLQKCLKGEAKEVVEALLIHPNNVERVMSALEFRFGRPECLLRSQLAKVRDIAPISEGKLEMLIPFSTRVQNLSTFLESSGLHQHLANPTLIDELVSKLPMSKRLEWAQRSVYIMPYPTLKHFDEWLSGIARLVCLVATNSLQPPVKHESKPKARSILHTTEQRKPADVANSNLCRHCKGKLHSVTSCNVYTVLDVEGKWNFVKKNRLCFCCLKYGHSVRFCKSRRTCGIGGCTKVHNSTLHEDPELKVSTTPAEEDVRQEPKKTLHSCDVNATSKILFRVLPVRLYNADIMVKTYALLDEGSSISLMSADLAGELKLNGERKSLNLQWLGRETFTEQSLVVDLQISADKDHAEKFQMNGVQTVSELDLPTQTLTDADVQQLYQYRNIPSFAEYTNAKPQLLIGLDNCRLGAPLRTIEPADVEPVITETKLGWVIYGKTSSEIFQSSNYPSVLHVNQKQLEDDLCLDQMVEEYFSLENFGVKKPLKQLVSADDERALQILSNTTKQVGAHYQTGLLWKEDLFEVPRSYEMAKRRLLSLESKLRREPVFASAYKDIIKKYLEKGYAKKLTDPEASLSTPRTWYLPHFGVKNPHKPDKTRLVFDAAAKVNDVSLNTFLLKGPDDLKPLLAILFNFRMRPVAVTGDIKEMFHQVVIQPEDQHSQRFLWRDEESLPINIYVMQSMTFGASCSPCSANFVKNLNAKRFESDFPRAVKAIVDHHYVDDYVDSFGSVAEAVNVTQAVIEIHKSGGFELCNFASNSKEVLRDISHLKADGEQKKMVDMNMDAAMEKVLGMCWEPIEDVFTFKLKFPRVSQDVMSDLRCPTKREFLSFAMSMFDPFGMIANFVIHIKLLLQAVWKHGVGWDEPIPKDIYERWLQWKAELMTLTQYRIPRCHDSYLTSAHNLVLHTFVDASEEAFSAVTYLRAEFDDRICISFVCGKTRCAPKKLTSIPRLELSAAILGVRLCDAVVEHHELAFKTRVFWSDSKTVIHWLQSDPRRQKQFVAFRITEILESTKVSQWRWIPSRLNPADEATRAKYPPKLKVDNSWITGPKFLLMPEQYWPVPPDDISNHMCKEEQRPKMLLHTAVSTPAIDFSRFSRYRKLQRTMGWVLRFVQACQRRSIEIGELSIAELNKADIKLCRQAQRDEFSHEISRLSDDLPIEKNSSIFKLTPYLAEDGLLRVYGRIDAATTIPFAARRPIIMPKTHPLTKLIVDHYHRLMHHQNDDTIANELRRKYWVPSVRSAVKKAKTQCSYCRIRAVQPAPPLMGQLPKDRLTPFVRPFTYTGLDYFGPVYVTVGRRKEKRWVALFTCMTIRAIHLEIASDLSTDACILCIRNFVNRSGVPLRIRSDNGTNFIGAKKELLTAEIFDNDALKTELCSRGIDWVFNCPLNPHAGGCWERLVRSVKRALSYTLNEIAPKPETLMSSLLEAENIINSRPLTHLPVSSEDEEPLTPNHFLLGASNSTQSPGEVDNRALCLRKQWRVSQQIKNHFWRRWIREYLPDLTRRSKWYEKVRTLIVGDLVLICEVDLPRSQWKRGRITKVFPGADGQVRTAEVKTATGTFRRPAVKLAVLDVGEALEGPCASRGVEC